ncbi:hypothetical protein [Plesiocystis pacifica]|uniref:hypothetical protein n=1 Tax=Plesiocystis pacifica TaxID=191768 RepID=UPI0012F9397A|nr:hypothetical protein [Plesiocystis pacifica]
MRRWTTLFVSVSVSVSVIGLACDAGPRPVPNSAARNEDADSSEREPESPRAPVAQARAPAVDLAALRGQSAPRPVSELERSLAGTWTAKVGPDAPRPVWMKEMVMLQTHGQGAGAILDAVEKDRRVATNCVWLELYANLRGFRNECMLLEGTPQALQQHDPNTGAPEPYGVAFSWTVEDRFVRITYDHPMLLPAADGEPLEFRETTLELRAGGGAVHTLTQAFPEHPEVPGVERQFEIAPGSYLD